MLNHITLEKVEEVISLAEQARKKPQGRADDPRRAASPPKQHRAPPADRDGGDP